MKAAKKNGDFHDNQIEKTNVWCKTKTERTKNLNANHKIKLNCWSHKYRCRRARWMGLLEVVGDGEGFWRAGGEKGEECLQRLVRAVSGHDAEGHTWWRQETVNTYSNAVSGPKDVRATSPKWRKCSLTLNGRRWYRGRDNGRTQSRSCMWWRYWRGGRLLLMKDTN